ncbi:alpha/beta hydrolase [Dyadobacter sandarakinus]|uniref:Alpha/beta hydrolase n=1 Tax=Dyadobacter sandarakinus TaxID=2747268 RepID=A0ABX7I1S3_9BACT|nr:alpha/beta hydrolase [Dyadobacter sandarakinus]QRR00019.1 alpha/beta hydrolase [Dyadobacter sandarakinus]
MHLRLFLSLLFLVPFTPATAQLTYYADLLGHGFQQATVVQPSDYEGSVTCTIIRKPAPARSNKAVLYVHGFNDYFFQEEMADKFNAQGYNFYAVDLRKSGRSWLAHQKLNNVRDLAEYFPDLDTALAVIRQEGSSKILLSAHDLGGLTAALYADARRGKELFDAVLLNSPMFALNVKSPTFIIRRAEKNPDGDTDAGISSLYGESLHETAHGTWRYNLSWKPIEVPPVSYGWVRAVALGLEKLDKGLQIERPVLVLHAAGFIDEKKWSDAFFSGDAVTNINDIETRARNIQGQYSIQAVPGGMHDLILSREPARDEVYSTMLNWARRVIR